MTQFIVSKIAKRKCEKKFIMFITIEIILFLNSNSQVVKLQWIHFFYNLF